MHFIYTNKGRINFVGRRLRSSFETESVRLRVDSFATLDRSGGDGQRNGADFRLKKKGENYPFQE